MGMPKLERCILALHLYHTLYLQQITLLPKFYLNNLNSQTWSRADCLQFEHADTPGQGHNNINEVLLMSLNRQLV